ncbi:AAA family ATPase, partial [Escherichia coli]|uniref:AAA family ATPase n=1 Tax=Escherichia coli TaxID=562 RepID=UPI001484F7E7
KRPYSVVLLDEVEKAHRDVMNPFYQVINRGFMRDVDGRVITFPNTVLLMTVPPAIPRLLPPQDENPDHSDHDPPALTSHSSRTTLTTHADAGRALDACPCGGGGGV